MRSLLLFLLLGSTLSAQLPQVQFPKATEPLKALSEPGVDDQAQIYKYSPELAFAINSTGPMTILTSPPGVVQFTEETFDCSFKVKGRWIDKPNVEEWRTFKGKYHYTLEMLPGVKSQTVEVIAFPKGIVFADKDIIRRKIEVVSGKGAQPPPADTPVAGKVYFAIVRGDGPATTEFRKIMELEGWDQLRAKGYLVGDVSWTDAINLGLKFPPGPIKLPVVVPLLQKENQKSKQLLTNPLEFPNANDKILELEKVVKQ